MKKVFCIFAYLFLLFSGMACFGQKSGRPLRYDKISMPEKLWVLCHPFSAGKAFRVSMDALRVTDSLDTEGILDGDNRGGLSDAFKHAYWMARLAMETGKGKAKWLGKAHEKGNYSAYKKGKRKGLTHLHDKESSDMDAWNNAAGLQIARDHPGASKRETMITVLNHLGTGRMMVLLKNSEGEFTGCNGNIIRNGSSEPPWESGKCLVPSSFQAR
ncbi:MAG: hypothetical protein JXA03_10750 [Bacteroidales bacterium]|nr:hypothetical protein [Bacteroidales bacterium]